MLTIDQEATCYAHYPVEELAREYGTPLYVYDQKRILENYERLTKAYRSIYDHFEVFYAVKANNNPAIVRTLAEAGCGADASCIQEIQLAKISGVDPSRILFTGVYTSREDFNEAAKHGVIMNLEDITQLDWLEEMPEVLSFRVNPGLGGSGDEGLVFAGPDAKFGVPENQIIDAYKRAKERGAKRFGIHMMTGSNILDVAYFGEIVDRLISITTNLMSELDITFEFMDIGGSLGVPYETHVKPLDIGAVARTVVDKINSSPLKGITLMHEPGRYLVADAGILITRVNSIKRAERTFIGVDAGMNTLLRPALYDAYHPIYYVPELNATGELKAHIVGPICENTDIIGKDRLMPKAISEGDLLVIGVVGAYGFCMSSQYNTRPRAAEVLMVDDKPHLIRARETFEDLILKTRSIDGQTQS